jgi:transcriptional regulator with XRE-family HTH domain
MSKEIYTNKYKKLTEKLKKAREDAGLTQVQASERLGKPQSYFSKIERGERRIDAVELAELARIYKKSLDYFVS